MYVDQAQALREMMTHSAQPVADQAGSPAGQTPQPPHSARTVAIASGKGGVGKTSLSVNLAVRLASLNRRVVLLDADLGTANADLLCNLTPRYNIAHVIAGRCSLERAMAEAPGGFHLIAGASGLAQVAALNDFQRRKLIGEMERLEKRADIILIDTGAGIAPNVLSFATSADQLVVVTTPEPTAITDAYAVIKTAHRQCNDLDVRVLINMVADELEARSVFERIDGVCRRFLGLTVRYAGYVVRDARVAAAVRHRRPFVLESPQCRASGCISRLAHRMDRLAVEPDRQSLLRRMAGWMARRPRPEKNEKSFPAALHTSFINR